MRKRLGLILSSIFLFAFMFSLVSATVTISTPSANGVLSGLTNAWQIDGTNGFNNITSCQIWASSSSTANSTAVNWSQAQNGTLNSVNVRGNLNLSITRGIEDASDYSIYGVCTNSTVGSLLQQNTSTVTVTINNTKPQIPSSLSPSASSIDTDGSVTFSATVTGENTTSCILYFPKRNPGVNHYTMTHSSNSCTYTLSSVPEQTYDYIIEASDGLNAINSTQTLFGVDVRSGGVSAETLEYIQDETGKPLSVADQNSLGSNKNVIWWVVGILLVIVVVYFARKK